MTTSKLSANLKWIALVSIFGLVALMAGAVEGRVVTHANTVARGKYLVEAIGCADCHTPLVMTERGPERDMKRSLSGHPSDMILPPAPVLPPGPWMFTASGTMTAWSGPWGTSFTANLTPDRETGLGAWTADQFLATIRTQRHMGIGRPLLPPMPAEIYASMTDEDLRSIFAYLQSIPAVVNKVPEPLPPVETR
ncbi:MAG: diheme cytochrome c-553 [Planctomycetes bacterium]|nr:diheme cytochrome c-553 [Planctomycetota bacterium]